MEGITEIGRRHLTAIDIVAVALVDNDAIGDFHDAALDALQLIACASHLNQKEEIDHRVAGRLALTYAYRLDKNLVEACGLAEDDGLTGLTGHTS